MNEIDKEMDVMSTTSELNKPMEESIAKSYKIVNMMKKDHGHSNGYLVVEYMLDDDFKSKLKPKDSIWCDDEICLYWTQDNLQKEGMRSDDKIILGIAPILIVKDEQWELRMFKELKAKLAAIRSGYPPSLLSSNE